MSEIKKDTVTSLRVNPKLWKEARVEAIKHDITLSDLVEEAITEWIKKKHAEEGSEHE